VNFFNSPASAPQLLAETGLAAALNDAGLASRVVMEINPRARRISLRVDPAGGCVVLVRPRKASDSFVRAFLASKADWIAKHLDKLPPRVAFADGAPLPFRGVDHIVRVWPEARGGVWREGGEIIVTGRMEHTARRLRDWLKAEARNALTPLVHDFTRALGARVTRITVRDTRSRWGSCTRDGKLAFSWRLILAPDFVLTYVAAHEAAHLKHMNHGPAFWRTVAGLLESHPDVDARLAREWLRRSGAGLHRYG